MIPSISETTCGSLLQELQRIWDEIGESDSERDKILLQLERECLNVYRRKVEQTSNYKAELHQALAEAEAEAASLISALGERASFSRSENANGTLKEQISAIKPVLEDLRRKKGERMKEFREIQSQIVRICAEMAGNVQLENWADSQVDERDLTVKKLGNLKSHLQELQTEKSLRLQKVNGYVNSINELTAVMSIDLLKTINEVHPSLVDSSNNVSKSISNDTLSRLVGVVNSLQEEKKKRLQKQQQRIDFARTDGRPGLESQSRPIVGGISTPIDSRVLQPWKDLSAKTTRFHKEPRSLSHVSEMYQLQDLGSTLIELWNLMDTPVDEQKRFDHVTSLISACVTDLPRQGSLALDVIEETEVEVERLNVLKASKMKELILKKQNELEEIYRGVHLDVDSDSARQILMSLTDSGNGDLSDLLLSMDDRIVKAKEQALSRKDILEKVEKWTFACEEENWLDDYERDQNRYSAGRGAHKNLKRAEKARILVGKIPSMVENLTTKVTAWEEEKGIPFMYDKFPLLRNLEEYRILRQEREEDKRKFREQKRLQEQLASEQEALFGSKPSPMRPPTLRKPLGQSTNSNTMVGTPTGRRMATSSGNYGISAGKQRKDSGKVGAIIPVNYVALPKDDSVSRNASTFVSP